MIQPSEKADTELKLHKLMVLTNKAKILISVLHKLLLVKLPIFELLNELTHFYNISQNFIILHIYFVNNEIILSSILLFITLLPILVFV